MGWVSKTFESLLPLHPYFIKYYFCYSLSAFSPLQMNSFLNTEMPGIDGIKSNAFLWEICIIKGFRLLHSKHQALLVEFLMSVIFGIFYFHL